MQKYLVTVVIPIYKIKLSKTEQMSLNQCLKILGNYNLVFVHPEDLDVSSVNNHKISSEKFPKEYFTSVFGYNSLLLSEKFYERFLHSKFILIYQLDAFVFKDELKFWCNKNYDYIGAPWIASPNTIWKKIISIFNSKQKKERSKIFFKVGNGGLSLRNTQKSFEISKKLKTEITENLKRNKDDFYIMEDVFWSITAPKYFPDFTIPNYKEALNFAIDRKPHLALKLNNNKLPFGCHGFEKPKVKEFWKPILKEHYLMKNHEE